MERGVRRVTGIPIRSPVLSEEVIYSEESGYLEKMLSWIVDRFRGSPEKIPRTPPVLKEAINLKRGDWSPLTVLLIDVETTGLPERREVVEGYSNCRVTEIAWRVIVDGEVVSKNSFLLFDSREAAAAVFDTAPWFIIDPEEVLEKGAEWSEVISALLEDIKLVNSICAHNVKFDMGMILSELMRIETPDSVELSNHLMEIQWLDTLRWRPNSNRMISLKDSHLELTGERLIECHRAFYDVEALQTVFFSL